PSGAPSRQGQALWVLRTACAALTRGGAWGLARSGRGRGRGGSRRRLTGTPRERLTVERRGDVGTASAIPAERTAFAPLLAFATSPLLLGACSYLRFPTFAVSATK